jgi:hypothetical protein
MCLGGGQPVGLLGWHPCLCISPHSSHPSSLEQDVRLCLIAPCWLNQARFPIPVLLELLADHSYRLAEWHHLLWHPIGKVFHETPTFFKLHAWRLCRVFPPREAFQTTLSRKYFGLKVSRPLLPMTASGSSSETGVKNT